MRKHHFVASFVIFVAGFALSAVLDGRNLASLATGTLFNPAVPTLAAQNTRTNSTLQKWEYRVVTKFILQENRVDIDFELNRLGEQGYEVCGVAQSSRGVGADLTITLRRPK